jgi:uncharacterized membrane protein (UPF0127 family)
VVEVAGVHAHVAVSRRARLLGLALLAGIPDGAGLLIPRCRSVHTVGMRFPLDLTWLDARARVVRVDRAVRPWRIVTCKEAAAVVESRARATGPRR